MVPWCITLVVSSRNRNVEVDDELWLRVKALAVTLGRPMKAVVENGLRLVLASRDHGSVATSAARPAAAADAGFVQEMGAPSAPNEALRRVATASRADAVFGVGETIAASEHVFEGGERVVKGKPSVDELKRMMAATGARVGTGADLAAGTMLDATSPTDPSRGKATVEQQRVRVDGPSFGVSPESLREAERQRIARQNHLRTAPEDESQVRDDDGPGF